MIFPRFLKSRWRTGAVAAVALLFLSLLSSCGGQSYSCGTGDANHCYGTVSWTGSPTGFSMELTAVPLTSGDIFIDDEGWLIDYYSGGMSWVEAGEENVNVLYEGGYGTTYYFWAYGLNYGTPSQVFMAYQLGPVAQADLDHGNWIVYKINQDPKTATTWNVRISEASTGTVLYTAACTGCSMTPNTVLEGQELAGSQNAQAPLAFFAYNTLFQGSTSTLRTADGTVTSNKPPNANWWFGSKPSETSNGGMFFTDCC
jgi:hypothetical protein